MGNELEEILDSATQTAEGAEDTTPPEGSTAGSEGAEEAGADDGAKETSIAKEEPKPDTVSKADYEALVQENRKIQEQSRKMQGSLTEKLNAMNKTVRYRKRHG